MPRPDAPGASASLKRLERLLRRQQDAIRKRRPALLLEVTEALEAAVSQWAAGQDGAPQVEVPSQTGTTPVQADLSEADRRLLQRVRTLQQSNQALLEQEASWVQFMLEHLRPGLQTYSGDGRLTPGEGRVIIDRHA